MLSTTCAICRSCRLSLLSISKVSNNLCFSRNFQSCAFVYGELRLANASATPSSPPRTTRRSIFNRHDGVQASASSESERASFKRQGRPPLNSEDTRGGGPSHPRPRKIASKSSKYLSRDKQSTAHAPVRKFKPLHRSQVRSLLRRSVEQWTLATYIIQRLVRIGVSLQDAKDLLRRFRDEMPDNKYGWFPPQEDKKWQMERIIEEMEREQLEDAMDRTQRQRRQILAVDSALMRRFLDWAAEATSSGREQDGASSVSDESTKAIQDFYETVDYTHPEEWYPSAREKRRKIIMHVGPTNSGKTHNALRALAAARVGVYASPLRLLAFEIFHRLNNGYIVPLGADPSAPPSAHKRVCNLVTGEERRIVTETAAITSCTVEMLNLDTNFDVAVVDEVQMLADPDRGGAWTAAILGLNANEIHLCGEEGAVPLVQDMLEGTGDELVVQRYERLTPLAVESSSLGGDLRNINRGDCLVVFSRSGIFNLKRRIESETKMKCAVVYGRLPPEVRSEQADLFNDTTSGYDVLIGSDAIGMGLNLKIKRIVFVETTKYNGRLTDTLSLSQLKQIAGRAGRYGLHDDEKGGTVTAMFDEDLPIVRKAVEMPSLPLTKRATLPLHDPRFRRILRVVPNISLADIFYIEQLCVRTRSCFALQNLYLFRNGAVEWMDSSGRNQTLRERLRVLMAPIQWGEDEVRIAAERYLGMLENGEAVDIRKACEQLGMFEALEAVQTVQKKHEKDAALVSAEASVELSSPTPAPPTSIDATVSRASKYKNLIDAQTLMKLESLYRMASLYMWYNMNLPTAFHDRTFAKQTKEACEDAIEWCLAMFKVLKLSERSTRTMRDPRRSEQSKTTRQRLAPREHERGDDRSRSLHLEETKSIGHSHRSQQQLDRAGSRARRGGRNTTARPEARRELEVFGRPVGPRIVTPTSERPVALVSA